MMGDHIRAERDARAWCNDAQSSTGNLGRCYLDLLERVAALEVKQEAVRDDMRRALDMVDRMIETVEGMPLDDELTISFTEREARGLLGFLEERPRNGEPSGFEDMRRQLRKGLE